MAAGAPPNDNVKLARIAAAVILGVVAGTEFLSAALARGVLLAAVWAIFGAVSVLIGFYLFRGRFTAWGSAIIVNAFATLVALVLLDFLVVGALIASFVVLYVVRLHFGVGAWKIEADKENERARSLIARRTQNPSARCPKCGNENLWIAEDGSAFCLACQAGTIELPGREPS